MEITEVKVFPVNEDKLKAFVSIVFDHCFMVNDIKIIQGRQGLFISMPSRKKKSGEFKDVAHPLNNETRKTIETLVLSEYDRVLGNAESSTPRPITEKDEAPAPGELEPKPQPLAATAAPGGPDRSNEEEAGRTLEEVEELHLRDSFWTVP